MSKEGRVINFIGKTVDVLGIYSSEIEVANVSATYDLVVALINRDYLGASESVGSLLDNNLDLFKNQQNGNLRRVFESVEKIYSKPISNVVDQVIAWSPLFAAHGVEAILPGIGLVGVTYSQGKEIHKNASNYSEAIESIEKLKWNKKAEIARIFRDKMVDTLNIDKGIIKKIIKESTSTYLSNMEEEVFFSIDQNEKLQNSLDDLFAKGNNSDKEKIQELIKKEVKERIADRDIDDVRKQFVSEQVMFNSLETLSQKEDFQEALYNSRDQLQKITLLQQKWLDMVNSDKCDIKELKNLEDEISKKKTELDKPIEKMIIEEIERQSKDKINFKEKESSYIKALQQTQNVFGGYGKKMIDNALLSVNQNLYNDSKDFLSTLKRVSNDAYEKAPLDQKEYYKKQFENAEKNYDKLVENRSHFLDYEYSIQKENFDSLFRIRKEDAFLYLITPNKLTLPENQKISTKLFKDMVNKRIEDLSPKEQNIIGMELVKLNSKDKLAYFINHSPELDIEMIKRERSKLSMFQKIYNKFSGDEKKVTDSINDRIKYDTQKSDFNTQFDENRIDAFNNLIGQLTSASPREVEISKRLFKDMFKNHVKDLSNSDQKDLIEKATKFDIMLPTRESLNQMSGEERKVVTKIKYLLGKDILNNVHGESSSTPNLKKEGGKNLGKQI